MIAYTRPAPAVGHIKNYTVLDLNGDDIDEIRDRWLRSVGDLRYWCFNSTNNRFMFGSKSHRCAMVPEEGNFYIYLLYGGNCMCLVIEGSTLYLVGLITSTLGSPKDWRVWEMCTTGKQGQYIEGSQKIAGWYGNYKDCKRVQVGCGPLRSSFRGMFKYTTGAVPQPSLTQVYEWCDTLVVHFPEAARTDALALCSIYHRFSCGGQVGETANIRAKSWSSDCRGALLAMTLVEIDDEPQGKKKTGKRKEENMEGLIVKKTKRLSEEEVQVTIKDIRLFHRTNSIHKTARLASLPFQLRDGQVVGSFPKDPDEEIKKREFLVSSVNEFSHDACGYSNGDWKCKGLDANQKEQGVGLYNLGNTCYMNSTLQCLHSVPELKSSLLSYQDTANDNPIDQASHDLTLATCEIFNELDKSFQPVTPKLFLQNLNKSYTQFGYKHDDVNMPQDAEKCWSHLVDTLSQTLTSKCEFRAPPMKELFGINLVNRVHCAENEEDFSEHLEPVHFLKCHISQDVNQLHEGLKLGLKREVKRYSAALRRSVTYTGEATIDQLPRYLTVKFERLIWKKESNQNSKILRKVDYPMQLDVHEFCSKELKEKLHASRQMLRDARNALSRMKTHEKGSSSTEIMGSSSSTASESSSMDIDQNEPSKPNNQLTGIYDLSAVLTHKGSGYFGHYVAWVKQLDGNWVKFDDVDATVHKEEDILKLSGGGDDHMAYICLYKAHED